MERQKRAASKRKFSKYSDDDDGFIVDDDEDDFDDFQESRKATRAKKNTKTINLIDDSDEDFGSDEEYGSKKTKTKPKPKTKRQTRKTLSPPQKYLKGDSDSFVSDALSDPEEPDSISKPVSPQRLKITIPVAAKTNEKLSSDLGPPTPFSRLDHIGSDLTSEAHDISSELDAEEVDIGVHTALVVTSVPVEQTHTPKRTRDTNSTPRDEPPPKKLKPTEGPAQPNESKPKQTKKPTPPPENPKPTLKSTPLPEKVNQPHTRPKFTPPKPATKPVASPSEVAPKRRVGLSRRVHVKPLHSPS